MAGVNNDVSVRPWEHPLLKRMLSIHCIYRRLALECAYSSNQLKFLGEFQEHSNLTLSVFQGLTQEAFYLCYYYFSIHDWDTLPMTNHWKFLRKVKKNGATNFSRVIPNDLKTKTKLQLIFVEGKPMKLLNDNLQERLNRCNFQINEDRLMIG